MNGYFLGTGLMTLGAVLFFVGRLYVKRDSVRASGGSVAIGGNNTGAITTTNINQRDKPHSSGHLITMVAIFVEIAGIAVTIWHAMHLAEK